MKKVLYAGLALGLASVSSFAALDTSNVQYDTADVFTVGALVLAAVATIWGVRKAITIANRG